MYGGWRYYKKRPAPPKMPAEDRPRKKRRTTEGSVAKPPVIKDEKTASEMVETLNEQIRSTEVNIESRAEEFQKIRTAMLTGIVSCDGVQAEVLLADLTKKLADLKAARDSAISQMDEIIMKRFSSTMKPEIAAAAASGSTRVGGDVKDEDKIDPCVGGCKPENLIFDNTCYVDMCKICGTVYDHRIDATAEHLTFSDSGHMTDIPRRRGGGYKPPNHFAEILAQFQGTRRSTAPKEIVEMIRTHCIRYDIPTHKITPQVVRLILKDKQQEEKTIFQFGGKKPDRKPIKYTDYYKHCTELASTLSGIPPPYMTPKQQDKVVAMFPMIVAAYRQSPRYLQRKSNRKDRKKESPNMLNYYYTLYKICQKLDYKEFLPYIPLPKSRANIADCDVNGWKFICESQTPKWSYTPTI